MNDWLERTRRWWRWRRSTGGRGEHAAARHLRRRGYRLLARNLRSRIGEIDIVAEDRRDRTIVIVEVKTATADAPPPEAHVNYHKQRKISILAAQLVRTHRLDDRAVRFDVIGIVWPRGARRPTRLTHHEGAFESTL